MKTLYLIILLGLVAWKGYQAFLRGRNAYRKDVEQYWSLREYLLGNGATEAEARQPFLPRALRRAYQPLMKQWRLWAIVAAVGLLVFLL
ncbi:MAG: hypothetical protein E7107_06185 [Prevotella sp.]|jgi:hypothetical protein|nr:hypothetical protein [Prevotella sp.]